MVLAIWNAWSPPSVHIYMGKHSIRTFPKSVLKIRQQLFTTKYFRQLPWMEDNYEIKNRTDCRVGSLLYSLFWCPMRILSLNFSTLTINGSMNFITNSKSFLFKKKKNWIKQIWIQWHLCEYVFTSHSSTDGHTQKENLTIVLCHTVDDMPTLPI